MTGEDPRAGGARDATGLALPSQSPLWPAPCQGLSGHLPSCPCSSAGGRHAHPCCYSRGRGSEWCRQPGLHSWHLDVRLCVCRLESFLGYLASKQLPRERETSTDGRGVPAFWAPATLSAGLGQGSGSPLDTLRPQAGTPGAADAAGQMFSLTSGLPPPFI